MKDVAVQTNEARIVRALQPSRRRLVRLGDGRWAVMAGVDKRRRPLAIAPVEMVERMAAAGLLRPMGEDVYALAPDAAEPTAMRPAPGWVFVAQGARRLGERPSAGFVGMARLAREGRGALNLRQAQAGLRLIADAERAAADARLTMDWNAGPATKQARAGSDGGRAGDALAAARLLERLRRSMGDQAWRMTWSLCVDGETLTGIRKRFAVARERLKPMLAGALEKLADAYDGQRAPA